MVIFNDKIVKQQLKGNCHRIYMPVLNGITYTWNLKSVFMIFDTLSIIINYYAIDVDFNGNEEVTDALMTHAVLLIVNFWVLKLCCLARTYKCVAV